MFKTPFEDLKVIGSVGEPINEEAWHWYNDNVGSKKCPIVDTGKQKRGIMIFPQLYYTNQTNLRYITIA
jgi:acetyl-CoA synthetase